MKDETIIEAVHPDLGTYMLHGEGDPVVLFCDNETNAQRLFEVNGATGHYKDAFS